MQSSWGFYNNCLVFPKERYYDYISRADLVAWWRNGTLVKRLKDIFFRYKPKYTGYADLYWHDTLASTTRRVSVLEQRLRERLVRGYRGALTRGAGFQQFQTGSPVLRPTLPVVDTMVSAAKKSWLTPPPVNRSDHRAYASYILNMNFTDESWEAIKEDGDHIRFEKFRRKPMDLDSSDLVSISSNHLVSMPLFPYILSVPNNSADLSSYENVALTSKEYEEFVNQTENTGKKLNRRKMLKQKQERMKQKITDQLRDTIKNVPSEPSEFSGEPANKDPIKARPLFKQPPV